MSPRTYRAMKKAYDVAERELTKESHLYMDAIFLGKG